MHNEQWQTIMYSVLSITTVFESSRKRNLKSGKIIIEYWRALYIQPLKPITHYMHFDLSAQSDLHILLRLTSFRSLSALCSSEHFLALDSQRLAAFLVLVQILIIVSVST